MIIDRNTYVVDIVEVTPVYDPSEITVFLAAKIIVEIAGIMAKLMHIGHECW